MFDTVTILIIIVVILAIMLFATIGRVNEIENKIELSKALEGFETSTGQDLEAIKNVASLYRTGDFTVTNLKVTGNLDVVGNSKFKAADIGDWKIREDRIGIPDRGDIHLHTDKWTRLLDYDTPIDKLSYAGTPGKNGGFAGANLNANSTMMSKNAQIDGVVLDKSPNYGGVFRIGAPLEVDQAMSTDDSTWNRPGIMAKNLIIPSRDFAWGQYWWQSPSHQTAVNVAKKMPEGSLVLGPAIGNNNKQEINWDHLVSAAKKVGKANCDVRGMWWGLNNHGAGLACG